MTRLRRLLVLLLASATLLAACGSSSSAAAPAHAVATYALPVGDQFSWILPLENEANYENYDSNVESGMWRPLYYVGGPGTTGIDYARSIGEPPIYSHDDTWVTIKLHQDYTWSDGVPVTTSDIRFFFELEAAGARSGQYAPYLPGRMPDDIRTVRYQGPYQLTLILTHPYNPVWFTGNQLTWIYPLPQQAWDRTCLSCHDGNVAATPKGAARVLDFLYAQSSKLSTYATNPLWRVVDGPWRLVSFNPVTYHAVFQANPRYTGPGKPHLAGYAIDSFTSATAEIDALRAGSVDMGYLPLADLGLARYFRQHGYTVTPWRVFYDNIAELGYTGPWRHLVHQLYFRQALMHLVNEPLYLQTALHGFGLADYGAAPLYPGSPYVAPSLRHDPYPYSIRAARALLEAHGWSDPAGSIATCARPGSGSGECGSGIARRTKASILLMYEADSTSLAAEAQAFATAARSAGIDIQLDPKPLTTMYSIAGVCPPGPCNWGIALYNAQEDFGQYVLVPTAGVEFAKGNYWGGGYYSPTEQRLLDAAYDHPGLSYLYRVETYQSTHVAGLWWPVGDYEIAVVSPHLGDWYPFNPYANYMPTRWTWRAS
jgi:peptide/nickel transport system substrate-binding protein